MVLVSYSEKILNARRRTRTHAPSRSGRFSLEAIRARPSLRVTTPSTGRGKVRSNRPLETHAHLAAWKLSEKLSGRNIWKLAGFPNVDLFWPAIFLEGRFSPEPHNVHCRVFPS
jgi:hypothetical protein